MVAQRIFYVTQESLSIWTCHGKSPKRIASFSGDGPGPRAFDDYLAAHAAVASVMLVDVIEEEFVLETIPKLGFRDRKELIERRSRGRFRRTPYRVSDLQGKANGSNGEQNVVISAISNHELIEPWIRTVLKNRTPMRGIFSVPHLAPGIFKQLFEAQDAAMFVAPHQGTKLRQVFLRSGHLRSARLSQLADASTDDYARLVVTETLRSRRYLERTRLLAADEILSICVVAECETQRQILALSEESALNEFIFIEPEAAAKSVDGRRVAHGSHFEETYMSAALHQSKQNYSISGESRYWTMRQMRNGLIGASVSLAAVCSVAAAVFLQDAWTLHSRVVNINAQVEQLSETFRRENEMFDPIRAGSYEMKQAVDSGDYILANRVPVPWVMNQLGQVMGEFSDIRVRELRWLATAPTTGEPARQRHGNAPLPVAIPVVATVSAVLTAELLTFDGDMKSAFTRIDQLAANIAALTLFDQAFAIEYPFDARTSAAVSGEIDRMRETEPAEFKLQVIYQVPGTVNSEIEGTDETI